FVLIPKWLSEIPWSKGTFDTLDVDKAHSQLEEDHYGLETVKKCILEFLSVPFQIIPKPAATKFMKGFSHIFSLRWLQNNSHTFNRSPNVRTNFIPPFESQKAVMNSVMFMQSTAKSLNQDLLGSTNDRLRSHRRIEGQEGPQRCGHLLATFPTVALEIAATLDLGQQKKYRELLKIEEIWTSLTGSRSSTFSQVARRCHMHPIKKAGRLPDHARVA
ncbi:12357_t:CDS:2, partial [Gigaspora rosea]